jgi:hypothetical protein
VLTTPGRTWSSYEFVWSLTASPAVTDLLRFFVRRHRQQELCSLLHYNGCSLDLFCAALCIILRRLNGELVADLCALRDPSVLHDSQSRQFALCKLFVVSAIQWHLSDILSHQHHRERDLLCLRSAVAPFYCRTDPVSCSSSALSHASSSSNQRTPP